MTRKTWKKTKFALHQLESRNCPTAGVLDPDFGGAGITTIDFGTSAQAGSEGLAIQADGKIIMAGRAVSAASKVGGTSDLGIVRLNSDGSRDTSFGAGGMVMTDMATKKNTYTEDRATSVAIQTDGKIVVAGDSTGRIALARYNSNGLLDTSFDGDGKVVTSVVGSVTLSNAESLQILSNGKILIGCDYRVGTSKTGYQYGIAFVRYNANGSLDTTFDGDGVALNSSVRFMGSMEVQSDGRIVTSANNSVAPCILRWNANGSPDLSFGGGDGKTEVPGAFELVGMDLHSDSIYVVGREPHGPDGHALIARFTPDGVLDPSFGVNGVVIATDLPFGSYRNGYEDIKVLDDGRIVVAGGVDLPGEAVDYSDTFIAARYLANGDLDSTFNGGIVYTNVSTLSFYERALTLVIQDDGRVVTAGSIRTEPYDNYAIAVARYLGDDSAPPPLWSGTVTSPTNSPAPTTPVPIFVAPQSSYMAMLAAANPDDDSALIAYLPPNPPSSLLAVGIP